MSSWKKVSESHTLTHFHASMSQRYSGLSHITRWGMRTLNRNNKIPLVSKNFLESALLPSGHHKGNTNREQKVGDEGAKATCRNETMYIRLALFRIERGLDAVLC